MQRTGYIFFCEGDYCELLEHHDNPNDEDWRYFQMKDLHPAKEKNMTIWPDNASEHSEEAQVEAIKRAVTVIEWMRTRKGWEGFCANLWLYNGKGGPEKVFTWDLC